MKPVSISPLNGEGLFAFALLILLSGCRSKAEEDPVIYYNKGLQLMQAGRIQEAIDSFQRAIQLKPDLADAHSDLGAAYNKVNRTQEAVGEFEQAIQLNPKMARAHYNLGNAYDRLGRFREAIAAYEQAQRLTPDDPEIYVNLVLQRGFIDSKRLTA